MSQWQDISTAPKDGSWILLRGGKPDFHYDQDAEFPPVVVAHSVEYRTTPKHRWFFCSYDSAVYGEYDDPTEWMPLPDIALLASRYDCATMVMRSAAKLLNAGVMNKAVHSELANLAEEMRGVR